MAVLVLATVLNSVANAWTGKVNELLGIESTGIERTQNPKDYLYQSDYQSAGDLVKAEIAYAAMVQDYKDAAVIVLGRDAGESCCFYPGKNGLLELAEFSGSPTGNIFSLSNEERDLIKWAKEQGFVKIVVLLNSGTAMEIEELKQDKDVDSIVWIGNPGAYGTYGIADLLKGNTLPSGHLQDIFAVNTALSPAAQNVGIYVFENAAEIDTSSNNALRASWYLAELEGIYTGYKYYETRYFDAVMNQGNAAKAKAGQSVDGSKWNYDKEVSYSFGYGLEGSSFTEEITDASIDWSGEGESSVTVKVTNTGDKAAKHAVQLYVSQPYTDKDRKNGIEKSAIQLLGYAKTGEAKESTFEDVVLLEPGQSEDVVITFNAQDFYTYDRTYEHDSTAGAWSLEAGSYYFATGNGAHDAVNPVLSSMGQKVEFTGAVREEKLDADIYQTTSNDVTIENRLDGADLNQTGALEVTYLSRNDWVGTFPKSVDTLTATEDMIYLLRNNIYDQEAEAAAYEGPESFAYGEDNGITTIQLRGLEYDDPKFEEALNQMTLQDLINQYIQFFEEIKVLAMPIESKADSPLGLIATIGKMTGGMVDQKMVNGIVDLVNGMQLIAPFRFLIFDYTSQGSHGIGGFLTFLIAEVLAQIVNFFVQKNWVFKSNADFSKSVPKYIVLAIIIIVVSLILPGHVTNLCISNFGMAAELASIVATVVNTILAVLVSYPLLKFWIMPKQ